MRASLPERTAARDEIRIPPVRYHFRGRYVDHCLRGSQALILLSGGTTACVVAGRLSAADSTLRILVGTHFITTRHVAHRTQIVENGRPTKDHSAHVQPGRFFENIATPGTEIFTVHSSNPAINLDGRCPLVSNSNCVGGGSSINGLTLYTDSFLTCSFKLRHDVQPRRRVRLR